MEIRGIMDILNETREDRKRIEDRERERRAKFDANNKEWNEKYAEVLEKYQAAEE